MQIPVTYVQFFETWSVYINLVVQIDQMQLY
jgi:hypothetical protein